MGALSSGVNRLRQELQRYLDLGSAKATDVQRACDQVASLLLRALWDDRHPLTDQLEELKSFVEEFRNSERSGRATPAGRKKVTAGAAGMPPAGRDRPGRSINPDQILFMPQ